jgi:hypothetical protein
MTDALSNAPEQSTRTNTNATVRQDQGGTTSREGKEQQQRPLHAGSTISFGGLNWKYGN